MPQERGELVQHTSVNHDEKLHEGIVDVARRGGLYDEDILVPDGLANRDTCLLIGVHEAKGLRDVYSQSINSQLTCQGAAAPRARVLKRGICITEQRTDLR